MGSDRRFLDDECGGHLAVRHTLGDERATRSITRRATDGDSSESPAAMVCTAAISSSGRVPIREIQVPLPFAHPHQWQADSLLGALLAGGAAALLLSTILVATMLNNLFTQQIPLIAAWFLVLVFRT